MPSIKRIAVRAAAAVMAGVMLMSSVAYADEPYDGYNYDWWEDPVPSQNGYVVDRVVNGADIGIGDFKEPEDMFISDDQLIYIADTAYITPANDGKGRIVVTDSDFNLVATVSQLDFTDIADWVAEQDEKLAKEELTKANHKKITDIYFDWLCFRR